MEPIPEFMLYGEIGDDPLFGVGIPARALGNFLASNRGAKQVLVRIHSPGGDLDQSLAMYNLMASFEGEVITQVDGYAMSAASVAMMGGTKRRCAANAMLMIHKARGRCSGTDDDHVSFAELLKKATELMAVTYAQRSKCSKEKALKMMAAETYMNADEALADGFVTEITEAKVVEASWDLRKFGYVKADEALARLKSTPAIAATAPITPLASLFRNSLASSAPVVGPNGLTADEESVRRSFGYSVEQFIANREAASK